VPVLPADDDRDTQPTLGFQRVLQRAVYHVQSSGRKEVTGANVLVAIFGEKDSHAVYCLQSRTSRASTWSTTSRTASPRSAGAEADRMPSAAGARAVAMPKGNPLQAYASNLNDQARAWARSIR
jgi:ATP-dependent Clp protease ATP-binding subunit ClpA